MQLEGCMKFHAQSFSRLASGLLVLALATVSTAAAQVAPPVGPYGFVLNATFSDPSTHGGAAILGLMNFDGAGNITTSPYDLELGSSCCTAAQHITGTFTGTYASQPDGTGMISVALDVGVNLTLAMVIDNHSRTLQLALTGCTGPICDLTGTVVSGVAEIEFNGPVHPVHQGFLNGSYGLQLTKSAPTPATSLEVWGFDGATGTVTRSGTFVGPDGQVVTGAFTGTYSVNPDGTGNMNFVPQPGQGAQTFVFVITNGHSGLLVLQTNRAGDGVMHGTGRLQ